jgi:hypothetical protein
MMNRADLPEVRLQRVFCRCQDAMSVHQESSPPALHWNVWRQLLLQTKTCQVAKYTHDLSQRQKVHYEHACCTEMWLFKRLLGRIIETRRGILRHCGKYQIWVVLTGNCIMWNVRLCITGKVGLCIMWNVEPCIMRNIGLFRW